MKNLILAGMLSLFFISPVTAQMNSSALLESLEGASRLSVETADGQRRDVQPGMMLHVNEKFIVPESVIAHLVYASGSQVIATSGSEILMGNEDSKEIKNQDQFNLNLLLGKIIVWVKSGKEKNGYRFKIHTRSAAMGVRGTNFTVASDTEGTQVHVMEGVLDVANQAKSLLAGQVTPVRKGFSVDVPKNERPKNVEKFNIKQHLDKLYAQNAGLKKVSNRAREQNRSNRLQEKYKRINKTSPKSSQKSSMKSSRKSSMKPSRRKSMRSSQRPQMRTPVRPPVRRQPERHKAKQRNGHKKRPH